MSSRRCGWVLLLLVAVAGVAFGQVTVDGNLADIIAAAQANQADPINELCAIGKSGFDFSHVYVFYNVAADQLFVGLDLMDVPPGSGAAGPGVPGDADGDNNADAPATNTLCVVPPFIEENGVGIDEEYTLLFDTNANGRFDEAQDIRVRYSGNALSILPGNSNVPIPGASGIIRLGTVGSPTNSSGIPDSEENRNTADIEIRVNNFSTLDTVPTCFILTVRGGSLVDGLVEDELSTPISFNISDPAVNVVKDVQNVTTGGVFADSVGAQPGETVRFRIAMTNTGNVVLNNAALRDTLPAGLSFAGNVTGTASFVVTPQGDGSTRIDFTNLAGSSNLPAGATRIVTFDATVGGEVSGCLINSVLGGGRPPAESGGPPVSDSDTAQICLVDLQCSKQVSLDGVNFVGSLSAARGQTVHFRVVISNPSAGTLTNVQMTDTLPAGYTNLTESDPQCSTAGNTITCNIGSLAGGASRTIDYRAVISNSASGTLTNTAHVTGTFGGTTLSDDCSAQVTVLVPCIECDKQVSLDGVSFSSSLTAAPGQVVTFRVRITNCGSAPFFQVSLSDTLPSGYSNVQVISPGSCSAAGNTVTCGNLGSLNPAATVTVTYRATVAAGSGTLTNTASVTGQTGSAGNPGSQANDTCSAQVQVVPPCIVCVKLVSLDGVTFVPSLNIDMAGATLFWRITVTNCGQAPLTTVTLHDVLPTGLINVSTADGRCGVIGNTVDCNLGSLAPAASTAVIIQSQVAPGFEGSLVNTATVTGTPGSGGNPGSSVSDDCSASVNVGPPPRIPTLSEWGRILLSALLCTALVLHRRMR